MLRGTFIPPQFPANMQTRSWCATPSAISTTDSEACCAGVHLPFQIQVSLIRRSQFPYQADPQACANDIHTCPRPHTVFHVVSPRTQGRKCQESGSSGTCLQGIPIVTCVGSKQKCDDCAWLTLFVPATVYVMGHVRHGEQQYGERDQQRPNRNGGACE